MGCSKSGLIEKLTALNILKTRLNISTDPLIPYIRKRTIKSKEIRRKKNNKDVAKINKIISRPNSREDQQSQ